jgi:hypothetical protein
MKKYAYANIKIPIEIKENNQFEPLKDYIHIELCKFTTDYYKEGKKFLVKNTENEETKIIIEGQEHELHELFNTDHTNKYKWCIYSSFFGCGI